MHSFDVNLMSLTLQQLNDMFEDGETVNLRNIERTRIYQWQFPWGKILGKGELTKKLNIRVQAISDSAREKLTSAKNSIEIKKLPYRTYEKSYSVLCMF